MIIVDEVGGRRTRQHHRMHPWAVNSLTGEIYMLKFTESTETFYDAARWALGFAEDVVIRDGIEAIPDNAFRNSFFERISIPSTMRTIGEGAFSFCSKLESVVIPDAVTAIAKKVFIKPGLAGRSSSRTQSHQLALRLL